MNNAQSLGLPYLCGLLTIKQQTKEKGFCTLAELVDALEVAIGPHARKCGYSHTMANRMESRGFIARTVDGNLLYIDSKENNDELQKNLRMISAINSIVK